MTNVVPLHGDKRWKAVIEYRNQDEGVELVEHFFEEISDLHPIIQHGPDRNMLVRCTVTLNRPDGGEEQDNQEQVRQGRRGH